MTRLSHIEINVSDYAKSIRFYDTILFSIGWKKLVCTKDCTAYSDGTMKLILSPTDEKHKAKEFHRKQVGLNHLAFSANSLDEVNEFHANILLKNSIECLYEKNPSGDDSYYAVFFEDPDRIKIELVYAPDYCKSHHWTNQIESDFDPNIYQSFDFSKIKNEIHRLSEGKFDDQCVQQFIEKVHSISANIPIKDYFLHLSTDEGEELAIGFYNSKSITDITLSNGKIFSYSYPLSTIKEIIIEDLGNKIALKIQGEKKFDYNIVKPCSIHELDSYKSSLIKYLDQIKVVIK